MAGTATKILRPTVDGGTGSFTAWVLGAGATKVAAVDPGDPVSHDNDTSYIFTGSSANFEQRFGIDPTFSERMALVTEVRAHARVRDEGTTIISNELRVVLGTSNVLSGRFSTAGTSWTAGGNNVSKAMARPGGGDWTEDDFRDSTFRLGIFRPSQPQAVMRCTSLWLEVDYVPAVLTVEPHREVGSRELRLLQHEPEVYTVKLPLKFLSLGLTDMVRLAHDSVFASASVLSALSNHMLTDKWRQTPCFVLERTINFDDDTVTLKLLNAIPCLAMFWSTFTTPDDVNDDMDGMPLIHVGQELGVARTTRGYIPHPSSARSITRLSDVSPITEKRNHKGTLCELGATKRHQGLGLFPQFRRRDAMDQNDFDRGLHRHKHGRASVRKHGSHGPVLSRHEGVGRRLCQPELDSRWRRFSCLDVVQTSIRQRRLDLSASQWRLVERLYPELERHARLECFERRVGRLVPRCQ